MSGSEPDAAADSPVRPAGRGEPWWQSRRAAGVAWAALVVAVWNVVFDWIVIQSGRAYLTQQALHQKGAGPSVTIPGVMRPGVARGFWMATLVAGAVAAVGAAAFWVATRQRQLRGDAPAEAGAHDGTHQG
jgi:hypothetical protein